MGVGDRGKWAEGEIRKQLMIYSGWSSFAFMRLPDARAGSRTPTLADFMVMHKMQHSLLEVKEVKTHAYRLPHQNFDANKVSRIRAWQMAGSIGHVAVYFGPAKVWRYAPIDYFLEREGGSWDMRDCDMLTLKEVMVVMYGPPPGVKQ